MDNVALARATMGTSLGFHIVFAVLGVGMPLLMSIAEGVGIRRHDEGWLNLARRWSKLFQSLAGPGLPLLILAIVNGPIALWAVGRSRRIARAAVIAQVVLVLWAWVVGQWPYPIPPDLTISGAAALPGTLNAMLVVVGVGMALLLPSLWLLFRVFKSKNPASTTLGPAER